MTKPILMIGETGDLESYALHQALQRAEVPSSAVALSNCLPRDLNAYKVLVPTCEPALTGLIGKQNLTNWRGSIVPVSDQQVIIPTLPARALNKNPNWFPRVIADLRKAYKYANEVFQPKAHTYISHPNRDDIENFVQDVLIEFKHGSGRAFKGLSVDIETNPKEGKLLCVGFACSADTGICIPWQAAWQKEIVRILCNTDIPKVLQNGLYDTYWLAQEGVRLRNWFYDTLYMHHAMLPTEPHDLAFLTSIYTEERYYKDEAASHLEEYNCKDACVTWEIAEVLDQLLRDTGTKDFYREHYTEMYEPLLAMMLGGIRVDDERRRTRYAELMQQIAALRVAVEEKAGTQLYAKKALSPKKLQEYMYVTLKLPPRMVKQKEVTKAPSFSTDEVSIRTHINNSPKKFAEVGTLILEARRAQQLSAFYQPQRVDPDNYLRFSMKLNTEAGRLASSENPKQTGSNIQNQDRECRDMYVPDLGHIFMEFDLSQAESRVVYCLSGDKKLIEEALTPPWEFDHHTQNASDIFNVPMSEVTKEQRYLGKVVSHGAQRDMGGKKLQERLLKDGYVRTLTECDAAVEAYHKKHPGVREYFRWIRTQVMRNRCLANSWGRVISWPYEYFDDTLYRKAYSFLPQSEIAGLLNRKGLIPLASWLGSWCTPDEARLVCQVHDSLLVSAHPRFAWKIYEFVHEGLNYPLYLRGTRLTIPVETKIGLTWKGDFEFKKPVNEQEFNAAVEAMLFQNQQRCNS